MDQKKFLSGDQNRTANTLENAFSEDDVVSILVAARAPLPSGKITLNRVCNGEVECAIVSRLEALRVRLCEAARIVY